VLEPLFTRDSQTIRHPDCEGPPLTDEMVASAERELRVKLPKAYIELMQTCNGGYTRDAVLRTSQPTGWAPDHVPVDVIFGIPAVGERGRFGTGLGILATAHMTSEWGLPEGLVLLNGEGHWWIALDYRRSGRIGPPTVVWIDIERGEDLQLAESFESFLAGLAPASELRQELGD
jgi:hypothetical protein